MNYLFYRKYPLVKQYDEMDCGPVCLLSVVKLYKGNTSLVQLREIMNTSVNCSTILNLVKTTKEIVPHALSALGEYEDLMNHYYQVELVYIDPLRKFKEIKSFKGVSFYSRLNKFFRVVSKQRCKTGNELCKTESSG